MCNMLSASCFGVSAHLHLLRPSALKFDCMNIFGHASDLTETFESFPTQQYSIMKLCNKGTLSIDTWMCSVGVSCRVAILSRWECLLVTFSVRGDLATSAGKTVFFRGQTLDLGIYTFKVIFFCCQFTISKFAMCLSKV